MKLLKMITLLVLIMGPTLQAYSSLLVSPTRITFEQRERVEEVVLVNTSQEVRRYKLEWVEKRQESTNSYTDLLDTEAADFSTASPFIRFSPRRVTLRPNESQTIKLLARRSSNMTEPEYRSHLKFTALPPELTDRKEPNVISSGMNMELMLLLSYTVPVILRTEKSNVAVNIADVEIHISADNSKHTEVVVALTRVGTTSAYGNLTLLHRTNSTEPFGAVGFTNGVNLFHEISKNTIVIPWTEKPFVGVGEIKIVFEAANSKSSALYAEKIIKL